MDDLISRQAAIDALDQIFDRCEEIEANLPEGDPDRTGYKMYPDYMTVWKYLHQLPSAQTERKKGKWIGNMYEAFTCSCCGELQREQPTLMGRPIYNYCPNCGAYMRGEE